MHISPSMHGDEALVQLIANSYIEATVFHLLIITQMVQMVRIFQTEIVAEWINGRHNIGVSFKFLAVWFDEEVYVQKKSLQCRFDCDPQIMSNKSKNLLSR